MLNQLHDTALRLDLDLKIGNDFAVPDAGSLKLTIRGDDGAALVGFDKEPLPDTVLNHIAVEIPAEVNTLATGSTVGTRYVEVEFLAAGKSAVVKVTYRLIRFMPVQVGPEDVRQALGISYEELPDHAVDLYLTYSVRALRPSFLTALQSGTVAAMYANQILVYSEALRLAPSLRARILKQEEKDNALYTRFTVDFDKLVADLNEALDGAEAGLDTALGETELAGAVRFMVTNPVDRVTGV